ncbi:hypothetical protein THAOC_11148, partial [Thalassiosira oceanica]
MDPLLAYALAPMHLPVFYIPRGGGKTTWEPVSTLTSTATPCFHAEISGFEPPGTPQIQQVYSTMDPLLAYALAPMHLPVFYIPMGGGKTTWEPVSTLTSTATPCFHAEISGFEPPGTPQNPAGIQPVSSVLGVGVYPVWPSALYTPTGQLVRSVAGLRQPQAPQTTIDALSAVDFSTP